MVDVLSKNDVKLIKQIKEKLPRNKLSNLDTFLTADEIDKNLINECILKKNGTHISNVCFFKGTRDNHLIEANFLKLDNDTFVEEATNYAMDFLGAKTVVIFTDKKEDAPYKYESIGEYNGKEAWIMDIESLRQENSKYETNK